MEKSTHGVLFSSGEVPVPILSVVSSGTRQPFRNRLSKLNHSTMRLRTDASFGPKSWRQAATKPRSSVKTIGASALRMVSTMATHSHPVGRIIELLGTISTMKSKCETLVMALSELIWWAFVP